MIGCIWAIYWPSQGDRLNNAGLFRYVLHIGNGGKTRYDFWG